MKLMEMSVKAFVEELASSSPAPGGGTIAAVSGAFAAGLGAMVCALTLKKADNELFVQTVEELETALQDHCARLLFLADEDTEAFNKVMAAFRLPKETEKEKEARRQAIASANLGATLVPLETAVTAVAVCKILEQLAGLVNENVLSDCGTAIECAHTAALGAFMNVSINLPGVKDEAQARELAAKLAEIKQNLASSHTVAKKQLEARFQY